jgi:hypothetical protein
MTTLLVFYPFTRDFIPASFGRLKEQLHASKSPSCLSIGAAEALARRALRRRSRCVTGGYRKLKSASRGTQRVARARQIAI